MATIRIQNIYFNKLRSTPVIQEKGVFHLLRSPFGQNSNTYTQKNHCTYVFCEDNISDSLLKIGHDLRE